MASDDLVFLHSAFYPECSSRVDKRFAGYWTLQFAEAGGVYIEYEPVSSAQKGVHARYEIPPGEAFFWPAYPGPRIRFHVLPGRPTWSHRYVAFQGPRVARWIADGLWPEEPVPAPDKADAYAARFDALLAQVRRPDRWAHARAVHLLEGLLLDLAEARTPPSVVASTSPSPDWIAELLAEERSPTFCPDYEEFAHQQGLSLSTLRRHFRQATGTPLHEFMLQRRMARARLLLGESDLPIKAIADQLGYADVQFFTRQFRKMVGVPPAAYRRSRQQ